MKRLEEMALEGDSELSRAAGVVDAARRPPLSPERKAAVKAAVLQRAGAGAAVSSVTLVGGAVLAAAAVAVGGWLLWSGEEREPEGVTVPAPASVPAPVAPVVEEPAPVERAPEPAVPSVQRKVLKAKPATPPVSAGGAGLLLEALRQLRTVGDAGRALALCDEYLARFPAGPLEEEALATSVEALVALKDARASGRAKEYLTRFPQGRFTEKVRRAVPAASR